VFYNEFLVNRSTFIWDVSKRWILRIYCVCYRCSFPVCENLSWEAFSKIPRFQHRKAYSLRTLCNKDNMWWRQRFFCRKYWDFFHWWKKSFL